MSFTRALHNPALRRAMPLVVAIAIAVAALAVAPAEAATTPAPSPIQISQVAPQQQPSQPEANLPFLFAVFFITWAAFFAYIFVMSRRQREMQREIDILRQTLEEREHQAVEAEARPDTRTS